MEGYRRHPGDLETHVWLKSPINDTLFVNFLSNTSLLTAESPPPEAEAGIAVLIEIARKTTGGAVFAAWAYEIQMIANLRVASFVTQWQSLCRNGKFEKDFNDLVLCMINVHSHVTYESF